MIRALLLLLAAATLAGCGSTVGDACTVPADCGGQICLNKDYAPGGYCSKQCTLNDPNSCPSGTICIRDAIAGDIPGCFRACRSRSECRASYECLVQKDSTQAVCVGPGGI